jgi:hypothetical protein
MVCSHHAQHDQRFVHIPERDWCKACEAADVYDFARALCSHDGHNSLHVQDTRAAGWHVTLHVYSDAKAAFEG